MVNFMRRQESLSKWLPSLLLLLLAPKNQHMTESFSRIPSSSQPLRPLNTRQHPTIFFQTVTACTGVADFVGNDIGQDLVEQQNTEHVHVQEDGEAGILAELFGSTKKRDYFFQHTFGNRVAYFPRSNNPHLNVDQQEDKQYQNESLDPPISGIDLSSLYDTNEYTSLRKRGSRDLLDKTQMSYDSMTEYIADGGSIVIPVTPNDYLNEVKAQIEHALGVQEDIGTSMNIYHSGRSAVALNIHYDAYPVFVLQLEGEKEWIIQNDAFGESVRNITDWKNITMTEGDFMYIPKGVFHAATTAEGYETTTHATIGLL